jgi:hypothetical protein
MLTASALLIAGFSFPCLAQTGNSFDDKSLLQYGTNVNCEKQDDVASKMKTRWVAYSIKTNYSDTCFQAINRVQRINPNV